jgi:hypothetical protein
MTPLERGREAAAYFQQFVRVRRRDYAELMQNVHPDQGYGRSNSGYLAYEVAMTLYHYIDENFLNCSIPDNYGSPTHFRESVERFDAMLAADENKLKTVIDNRTSSLIPETIFMVLDRVVECRHAITETIDQLGPLAPHPQRAQRDTFETLEKIAQRFPAIVGRLTGRRASRPPLAIIDEYDVQYLFQAVMALYFDDIRPEEHVPSVAGGSGRADTLLRIEETFIEFKMTREGSKDTQIRKELADDFVLYAKHPLGKEFFVFIYDPGKYIENPLGFEADMSEPRPPLRRIRTFVQQG